MKKFKFLIFVLFLNACTSVEDAAKVLRNEKIQNTDEFLVEKRKPLVLPPDFSEIPEPGSITSNNNKKKETNIKEILNVDEEKTQSSKSSSVEDSILKNIRK
tara:strand:- start:184 stop:489 length:306 start_codon:yes stop_codon:yes gene_type:complete